MLGVWNKKRENVDARPEFSADEIISLDLTDRENEHFRYTY